MWVNLRPEKLRGETLCRLNIDLFADRPCGVTETIGSQFGVLRSP